jgi:hypothetical protein
LHFGDGRAKAGVVAVNACPQPLVTFVGPDPTLQQRLHTLYQYIMTAMTRQYVQRVKHLHVLHAHLSARQMYLLHPTH